MFAQTSTLTVARPSSAVCRRASAGARSRAPLRVSASLELAALSSSLEVAGQALLATGGMYFMMSYNEYATHRWYQHGELAEVETYKNLVKLYPDSVPRVTGGGHIEHHAETLDDMSLKVNDPKYAERWAKTKASIALDETNDPWRGTAFSWTVTGIMTMQMAPQVYPVYMGLMGWNFLTTTAFFLPSMILHALIWNALHPNMHGLPDVPLSEGAPSFVLAWMRDTPYFRYLHDNHAGHHVSGGRTNYNVACPLFDHIIGTFQATAVWKENLAKKELAAELRAAARAIEQKELAVSAPIDAVA